MSGGNYTLVVQGNHVRKRNVCLAVMPAAVLVADRYGEWGYLMQQRTKPVAVRNSFSRMPGSWSGINDPTGYEVGRKCPCLQKSEFTRNEKSELDFNALIRGHVLCRQHEGRRPHLQTDLTYL